MKICVLFTEVDYLLDLQQTVKTDSEGKWIFISDPLNTHKSASVVEIEEDLGGVIVRSNL
ncbi:MAG: hypothetical protein WCJ11_05560 [Methylococcaceae bacterium]